MDGLKSGFSKGLAKINLKTANLLEENKLRTYISTLQNEIGLLKSAVGEELYAQWRMQAVNLDSITPKLETIRQKEELIEEQKQKIEELVAKEKQILGAAAQEGAEQEIAAAAKFCPGCGNETAPGQKFCVKCGTPLA